MLQRKSLISSKVTFNKISKVLLLMFLTLSVLIIFSLPFFVKVEIECKSQYGECPYDINAKLQMLNFKNLRTAKTEIKKILKQTPSVTDYSIQFKLPPTLLVELLVKKPIFAIRDASNQIYLIDKDGKILSTTNSTNLPIIIQESSTPNLFALNLINGIFQMYQIRQGEIHDQSLVVELPTQIRVILPLQGDFEILLGSLRSIYSKIENSEQKGKFSEIDLRFRNPVLR